MFTAQCLAKQQINLPHTGIPALPSTLLTMPRQLPSSSSHLRHNTLRHDRLRPFHIAYGRSQRSMAAFPIRVLINHVSRSKHKFCRKLGLRHHLGLRISAREPIPSLPCLVMSVPYVNPVICSLYGYSSFRLGVRRA